MSTLPWLTLAMTDGLGPVLTGRLVERVGAEQASAASVALLRTIEGIGTHKASKIHAALAEAREEAKAELDRCAATGVRLICRDADDYPPLLAATPGPPAVLWVRGGFEPRDLHAVAVVGSRKCSGYGREQAERSASGLAGVGVTVVSGGARGVDTYAHRGALVPRNGRTIAVLGCGVDVAYPPENAELFAKISADGSGAVVSQFPLGTPPVAENFPRRNETVSGLSRGVLVVEGDSRSGASITARFAVEEHDRPVFAIPGRVDNPLSALPHRLIREGAALVERVTEVVDGLGPLPGATALPAAAIDAPLLFAVDEPKPAPSIPSLGVLSETQRSIVGQLDGEAMTVDALVGRSGLAAGVVLRDLTMLSLKGVVERVDGQRYRRRTPR